ncbi:MAG TPA: M48 family metalloprotease [Fimbriimonas sp.]
MQPRGRGCGGGGIRFLIAGAIALFSVCTYLSNTQDNPITGEKQRVDISPEQEIALGLQAAPQMAQQFGGLDPDPRLQEGIDEVGQRIVDNSSAGKAKWRFEFHALRDNRTVNAFALPGGQIFITRALLGRLKTEGQLAGVLAHEVAHVVARHGAEHIAKQKLTQGLTGAAVIATTDPSDPRTYKNAAIAAMIGQLVNMKFGREDELESDKLGVRFMSEAGYDPRAMVQVMQILAESGGGRGGPEFFQTHPNPENRVQKIKQAIQEVFPNGVPSDLKR